MPLSMFPTIPKNGSVGSTKLSVVQEYNSKPHGTLVFPHLHILYYLSCADQILPCPNLVQHIHIYVIIKVDQQDAECDDVYPTILGRTKQKCILGHGTSLFKQRIAFHVEPLPNHFGEANTSILWPQISHAPAFILTSPLPQPALCA